MPIPKWTIKGIVDDDDTRGCCAPRGLKRTVALMPLDADGNEDGTAEDVVYYGTSCAATALGWTQGKVTDTARAAQAERDQRDAYARRMISIYAPVEFAPVRDKARVYYGRNQHQRDTGVKASEEVAKLLDKARATLADTTTGPARPSRIEDFRRYLVILSRDERIYLVRRVPEDDIERHEQAAAAQRRADEIRGSALGGGRPGRRGRAWGRVRRRTDPRVEREGLRMTHCAEEDLRFLALLPFALEYCTVRHAVLVTTTADEPFARARVWTVRAGWLHPMEVRALQEAVIPCPEVTGPLRLVYPAPALFHPGENTQE